MNAFSIIIIIIINKILIIVLLIVMCVPRYVGVTTSLTIMGVCGGQGEGQGTSRVLVSLNKTKNVIEEDYCTIFRLRTRSKLENTLTFCCESTRNFAERRSAFARLPILDLRGSLTKAHMTIYPAVPQCYVLFLFEFLKAYLY